MQMNPYCVTPNTICLTACLRYNCDVLGGGRERITHAMGITVDKRRGRIWLALVNSFVVRPGDAVGFEALHKDAVRV